MAARLPDVVHGSDIVVERYDDPQAAAGAGWDEVTVAAGAPIFYSSRYLSAYRNHPLADIDRHGYLLVRATAGHPPIAVVPVALYQRPDPIGGLRTIHPGIDTQPALLSHVWHCYDTQLVVAQMDPRRLHAVAIAVVAVLRRLAADWGAQWFGFVNVEHGSPTADALTAAGLPGEHLVDRFTADLTGVNDFDTYLARLRHPGRNNFTRHLRRSADHGYTIDVTAPTEADLPEVVQLSVRTAARFNNAGYYPIDTFGQFVLALGSAAHLIQVRQYGRLVAAGVCLTDKRRFHAWTCGVDYDVAGDASPYVVFFAALLRHALRLGLPVFEGGRSNEHFKSRHGLRARPLDAHVAPV